MSLSPILPPATALRPSGGGSVTCSADAGSLRTRGSSAKRSHAGPSDGLASTVQSIWRQPSTAWMLALLLCCLAGR
jgi:hypothetical protein